MPTTNKSLKAALEAAQAEIQGAIQAGLLRHAIPQAGAAMAAIAGLDAQTESLHDEICLRGMALGRRCCCPCAIF